MRPSHFWPLFAALALVAVLAFSAQARPGPVVRSSSARSLVRMSSTRTLIRMSATRQERHIHRTERHHHRPRRHK